MEVDQRAIAAMDRFLDKVWEELDKQSKHHAITFPELDWAEHDPKVRPYVLRIRELEGLVRYELGRDLFVDNVEKWRKNWEKVFKKIVERRTDPFAPPLPTLPPPTDFPEVP